MLEAVLVAVLEAVVLELESVAASVPVAGLGLVSVEALRLVPLSASGLVSRWRPVQPALGLWSVQVPQVSVARLMR